MKMFGVLKGSTTLSEVDFVDLSDEHTLYCEDITKHWKQASCSGHHVDLTDSDDDIIDLLPTGHWWPNG